MIFWQTVGEKRSEDGVANLATFLKVWLPESSFTCLGGQIYLSWLGKLVVNLRLLTNNNINFVFVDQVLSGYYQQHFQT